MNFKIICDEKEIEMADFMENIFVEKFGKKWILTDENGPVDVKFVVRNCTVKYTPEKYDKITVDLDKTSYNLFYNLQKKVIDEVQIEPILKTQSIGLKLNKEMKEKTKEELKKNDIIDVVIDYNDVWRVNDKNYLSLALLEFKKIKKEIKPVKESYIL